MKGLYRVSSDRLFALNEYANELERRFQSVSYEHIGRERNTIADSLATLGKSDEADREMILQLRSDPPVYYRN
eukprot:888783-Prymnesium_polylepis.1